MSGWISLHRCLIDNPIFQNEKLLKVFVWCLLKATHKEREQLVGRQIVKLSPGQFVTGRDKASIELKMTPSTSWDYLKLLENNETINIKSNSKFSVVTVVNWESYQSENKNSDSKTDNESTTNQQQINTNNNVNNINKKDIPLKKEPKTFAKDDKEYLLASYLSKQIAKRLDKPLQKEETLQKWAVDFERTVKNDGNDIDEVKDVLVFSQKDPFWQSNILSAGKFRKQYMMLLAQMKREDG